MDKKFDMTIKEVCDITGLSRITLYNWRKQKKMFDFTKNNLSGRILYDSNEIKDSTN